MVCKQQIKVKSVSVPCQIRSDCGWGSAGGKNWDFLSGVTSEYVRVLCLCPKNRLCYKHIFTESVVYCRPKGTDHIKETITVSSLFTIHLVIYSYNNNNITVSYHHHKCHTLSNCSLLTLFLSLLENVTS